MNIQRIGMINYSNKNPKQIYANNKLSTASVTFCGKNRFTKNEIEKLINLEAELKPERLQEVQAEIANIKKEAADILARINKGDKEGLKVRQLQEWIDSLTVGLDTPTVRKEFNFSNGDYKFYDYKEREPSDMLKKMFGIGDDGNGASSYTQISRDSNANVLTMNFVFDIDGKLQFVDKHIWNQESGTIGCQVDLSKEKHKIEPYSI